MSYCSLHKESIGGSLLFSVLFDLQEDMKLLDISGETEPVVNGGGFGGKAKKDLSNYDLLSGFNNDTATTDTMGKIEGWLSVTFLYSLVYMLEQ